jgi:hypothetical protein
MSYIEQKAKETESLKSQQWQNLKAIAPKEAERIKAFGDAFGKLAKVRTEVNGKLIIDWG